MPPAIGAGAAIVGAAIAGTLTVQTLIAIAVSTALSFISTLLAPKPKRASLPSQDRQLSVRQAIGTRGILYGTVRTGGVQTFIHSSGATKEYLHVVVTLCGHRVRRMTALLLDDQVVPLDEDGNAVGKYAGFLKVFFANGTTAGDADFMAELIADCPDKWTADHKQADCAKIYLRYQYSSTIFPGNIPNPSVIVEGYDTILDPRTGTTGFTDNPALILAHYLRTSKEYGGGGVSADAIDDDYLIAAANACDEIVARKPRTVAFTVDLDAGQDITVANVLARLRLGTQVNVEVSGGGTLPAPLAADTDYYWIPTGLSTGRLATSLVNARAGTAIDLTTEGSGTFGLQAVGEPRYTANGIIDMDETPDGVIPRLLSAMAGELIPVGEGMRIKAGVYEAPDPDLDWTEDDLDGPIQVEFFRPTAELFNGIKGVFTNPDENFQPTDYPAVQDAAALAADGAEEWGELRLDFTNSPSMCQRLASLALQENRRQLSLSAGMKLKTLAGAAGDVCTFTRAAYGWEAKPFKIARNRLALRDAGGAPYFGIDRDLYETDSGIYAWDANTQEATLAPAATTTLPDPAEVAPPTALLLFPETADGIHQFRAEWTASPDVFVETYEVQYRLSPTGSPPDDPEWATAGTTGTLTLRFGPIDTGLSYDVRVRAVTGRGIRSDWLLLEDFDGGGDTVAPDAPTTGTPTAGSISIIFTGTTDDVPDHASVQIFYSPDPNTDPSLASQFGGDFSYGAGAAISIEVTGLSIGQVYNAWFKAKDAYGNQSGFSTMMSAATVDPGGGGA